MKQKKSYKNQMLNNMNYAQPPYNLAMQINESVKQLHQIKRWKPFKEGVKIDPDKLPEGDLKELAKRKTLDDQDGANHLEIAEYIGKDLLTPELCQAYNVDSFNKEALLSALRWHDYHESRFGDIVKKTKEVKLLELQAMQEVWIRELIPLDPNINEQALNILFCDSSIEGKYGINKLDLLKNGTYVHPDPELETLANLYSTAHDISFLFAPIMNNENSIPAVATKLQVILNNFLSIYDFATKNGGYAMELLETNRFKLRSALRQGVENGQVLIYANKVGRKLKLENQKEIDRILTIGL